VSKTESFEGRKFATSRRLSSSEIQDLEALWRDLPGRVGLSSNFGSQISRMQSLSGRLEVVENEEPRVDELDERASYALKQWQAEHPEEVLPPIEPRTVKIRGTGLRAPKYINGTIVAKGYRPDYIHCSSMSTASGCCRMVTCNYRDERGITSVELVTAPLNLEQWVEPSNEFLRRRLRKCWDALSRMCRHGDDDLVRVLFAVYGGSLPKSEFPQFEELGCLVVDTPTVLRYADTLTRRLRSATSNPLESRLTVTPLSSAHSLLDKRSKESPERADERVLATASVRRECEVLLLSASAAYREARN
jgi:hypothetical protein